MACGVGVGACGCNVGYSVGRGATVAVVWARSSCEL
jgi:hypothetical protein